MLSSHSIGVETVDERVVVVMLKHDFKQLINLPCLGYPHV